MGCDSIWQGAVAQSGVPWKAVGLFDRVSQFLLGRGLSAGFRIALGTRLYTELIAKEPEGFG